jgi:hypothetical protein
MGDRRRSADGYLLFYVAQDGRRTFAFGGRETVVSAAVSSERLFGFVGREAQTQGTGREIRDRDSEAAENEKRIVYLCHWARIP